VARPAGADVHAQADSMHKLLRDLRYEEAVVVGSKALWDATPADRADVVDIYQQLGLAYFLLGDEVHARSALVSLFALDPSAHMPEDASPKLHSFIERLQSDIAGLALNHQPLGELTEGAPIVLEVNLSGGGGRVDKVLVHYRTEPSGAYSSRRLDRQGGRFRTTLPGILLPDRTNRTLEYWFDGRDASGSVVVLAGVEGVPLRATIETAPKVAKVTPPATPTAPFGPVDRPSEHTAPIYKRWWFWGVVAGVAAGLATSVYFELRSPDNGSFVDVCVGFMDRPCPRR
jgi:hypothetical protein